MYGILGVLLFFWPEQMALVFAWKVTAFMTMTIGGWCLGNAWLAWIIARRWEWRLVYTGLIYLWLFGIFEIAVLLAFRDKVKWESPVAILYLLTLVVNGGTAIAGFADTLRLRPRREVFGEPVRLLHRAFVLAFVVFVGLLAGYGLFARIGWAGTRGGIFPEEMSLFTLRSFAVFYLALALAAVPLLFERSAAVLLNHSWVSYGLIVAITIAAFAYLRLFNFTERPGGLLYFGAYLVVGIPLLIVFLRKGTGLQKPY
jgi:hypothetical protein